ncbi:MAG: hypothetical protein ABJA16_10365, partial [Nakamurella sp.]
MTTALSTPTMPATDRPIDRPADDRSELEHPSTARPAPDHLTAGRSAGSATAGRATAGRATAGTRPAVATRTRPAAAAPAARTA